MNQDDKEKLWLEFSKKPSMELREKIIIEYAGLVKIVAGKLSIYLGHNVEYDDLRDVYDIVYPNIGYDLEGNISHRIRVITIPGTSNIITMYPSEIPIVTDKQKVYFYEHKKPMTRIERFNARLEKKDK